MEKYRKNIKLDYVHTFIRNINLSHAVWIAFLLYKEFDPFQIAVFETIFHITSLTMEVPTGIVADVFGRKLSRSIGILLYLGYIGIIILSSNFLLLAFGFVLCGLSYTFESGSGEALIYDSLKLIGEEDRFMKVNGNKEVIYQAATSIGLVLGGILYDQYVQLPFIVTGLIFIAALFTVFGMIETPIKKHDKKKSIKELLLPMLSTHVPAGKNKRLFLLILVGAMFFAPVTTLFLYFQGYIEDLGYGYITLGVLLGLHSLFGVIGGYFAFAIEKKFREKFILYVVPLFVTLSFWLVLIDSIVFLPFVLLGFFDSLMFVVMGDYINRLVKSEVRASVLSVSGFAFSVIMVIVFPIVGAYGKHINLKTGFTFLAITVTVFNAILLLILHGNHLEHKEATS